MMPRISIIMYSYVFLKLPTKLCTITKLNTNFCPQVRAPTESRLIFRSPANCDPSTCDIFVGIDTNTGNPGFLDIYMEASTQGWVAVGFSDSMSMVRIFID